VDALILWSHCTLLLYKLYLKARGEFSIINFLIGSFMIVHAMWSSFGDHLLCKTFDICQHFCIAGIQKNCWIYILCTAFELEFGNHGSTWIFHLYFHSDIWHCVDAHPLPCNKDINLTSTVLLPQQSHLLSRSRLAARKGLSGCTNKPHFINENPSCNFPLPYNTAIITKNTLSTNKWISKKEITYSICL